MDQVITYNKTYQERFLEYMHVLSGYEVLSVSQIKKEWSFYMELALDHNGWQALWKIPRLKCEEQKIEFPTIVLVYVEYIDCKKLEASVKILAVQDDIHLPSKHCVPLIQLWPTKEQDKSVGLNLASTANSLDMLRFFYLNIFMPWDLEEDGTTDWLSKHLETRLHLFYDMRNGTIPGPMAEHLKSLLTEARRLQARRSQLATQMDDDEELKLEAETQSACVQNLLSIHVRMLQIRNEVKILEIPLLRNALLKNQLQLQPIKANSQTENWLVFDHGNIDEHVTFLQKVENHIGKVNVKFIASLALALESASPNDTILLSRSRHVFGTTGALQEGGTLKGLYSKTDTIIATTNEDVMLDCNGDIILENLTIDVDSAQCGVLVRSGTVTMKNCKIVGDGESSTHQGVIVLAGGTLKMIDCDISEFYTAIVGNSGSIITLKNCEIFSVNVGLKIYDKCSVKAEGSKFCNCKDYGVCVETDNAADNGIYQSGGFAVLEVIPDVTTENVFGENNGKGDVIINQKFKLEPICDLFSNPDLDPTILVDDSSEEEMEVNMSTESVHDHNNTVIEVESPPEKSTEA